MPRKNIFAYEKLTLNYQKEEFLLLKNNNLSGSKYNSKRAECLITTIQKEMQKSEHIMDYQLKKFNITEKAKERLESKLIDKD